MSNFSGFISSFTGSNVSNDILSTVLFYKSYNQYTTSNNVRTTTTYNNPYSVSIPTDNQDGYFYIGNLLIQFSATNRTSYYNLHNNVNVTFNFPVSFSTAPFCVVLTATGDGNILAVSTTSNVSFEWNTDSLAAGYSTNCMWIAIGPR